jgi:hypothetical protein
MTRTANISQAAKDALYGAGTNRQGTKVQGTPEVLAELDRAGLIGPGGGLTRSGTIARQRVADAKLEEAFPW